MPDQSEHDEKPEYTYRGGCINPRTESLVVTCLLDEKRGITLKRRRHDLDDLPPEWIEESIESLKNAGVVFVNDTRIRNVAARERHVAGLGVALITCHPEVH
jgi:hypothetical protein